MAAPSKTQSQRDGEEPATATPEDAAATAEPRPVTVRQAEPGRAGGPAERADGGYVVPLVHTRLPARAVDAAFWGGLAGAAVVGVIDAPLALAVGAGVIVARHGRR